MKKTFIVCLLFIFLGTSVFVKDCFAKDFIVEFIEENYKETQAPFSYDPLIYHSIQVNSIAGPKILILTGSDYNYRKWLRHYIGKNKKFITKISDDRMDEFILAKAYEIDVTSLHPMNGTKWKKDESKDFDQNTLEGNNYILIVDSNEKRTHLIQNVVIKMGYQTIIFKTGKQALDFFKLQPDKFKMIIAQYTVKEMPSDKFVKQILKINHKVPILIDTGYKNLTVNNEFLSKFSGFRSVHLKPVILRDLQKTIETIIKKNV
ncbi:DNA-binding transcriptional response regulator [Desulfobacula phenolica]|uniref:Response regulator receiver domain-containing protein n=1 Tax=Desulfobacula phenolica TaxID=90732 RepID=A0A1H2EI02_9BACT|nr:response regulator [Desulfobacula phenolica]SDT94704.1 Response regulator receiver domain-containing protein [Desulfobacula phenolica]